MNVTNVRYVTVVENDVGAEIGLDEHGKSLMDRHNEAWRLSLRLRQNPFTYESGVLKARDVTGFVNLGRVTVEVVPKFLTDGSVEPQLWRQALWAILARVYGVTVLGPPVPGGADVVGRLPDLLGHVLLNSLRANRPNGRPSGYVVEHGNLESLRGRLDVARIVEVLLRPGTIPCEYDTYSEDVPVNRLLRWSAEQLANRVWSAALGHDLVEESMAFDGVLSLPPSREDAERITLAAHHALLGPGVTVGQMLLAGRGFQYGTGGYELPGFLWKSAEVFEDFVRLLVQSAARAAMPGTRVERGGVRIGERLDGRGFLVNYPDLRLVRSGATVLVLDAKYKTWTRTPLADDVRQVVTGAWADACGAGGLVYPSPTGASLDPVGWRLMGSGSPTMLWTLFVNLSDMGYLGGERVLVERLSEDLVHILPK